MSRIDRARARERYPIRRADTAAAAVLVLTIGALAALTAFIFP